MQLCFDLFLLILSWKRQLEIDTCHYKRMKYQFKNHFRPLRWLRTRTTYFLSIYSMVNIKGVMFDVIYERNPHHMFAVVRTDQRIVVQTVRGEVAFYPNEVEHIIVDPATIDHIVIQSMMGEDRSFL